MSEIKRIKVSFLVSKHIHIHIYILVVDKSIHLYEDMNETRTHDYVVMNRQMGTAVTQQTESQHYTHMSPLDRKQLSPNYENMNKF